MRKLLTNLQKRHFRVRSKVSGNAERPRMVVFKSNKYISIQLVDDEAGVSLLGKSSKYLEGKKMTKTDAAKKLGEDIAKAAIKKGIKKVTFDRGGYKYHGRVKALADAAREAGLEF